MRQSRQRTINPSRLALLASLGIDNFGSGLFLPLALVYATRVVGLDVGTAGVVVAFAAALGFAVPPVAGRLTHRLGPRVTVVIAQLAQGVGAVAYLLAGNATAVFAAAALMAIGVQLFYCSVFVLIAGVSTDEAKERPFALVGMVRAAAFGLGTLSAALVLAQNSDGALRWLVAVNAATFVVAAFLMAEYVVTDPDDEAGPTVVGPMAVLRDRSYVALMFAVCLLGGREGGRRAAWPSADSVATSWSRHVRGLQRGIHGCVVDPCCWVGAVHLCSLALVHRGEQGDLSGRGRIVRSSASPRGPRGIHGDFPVRVHDSAGAGTSGSRSVRRRGMAAMGSGSRCSPSRAPHPPLARWRDSWRA